MTNLIERYCKHQSKAFLNWDFTFSVKEYVQFSHAVQSDHALSLAMSLNRA